MARAITLVAAVVATTTDATATAAARPPTDDALKLLQASGKRVQALAARIGAVAMSERTRDAAELRSLEDDLEPRLGRFEPPYLDYAHLTLYRSLVARAQHDPDVDETARTDLFARATKHAEVSGSGEAFARARLLEATHWMHAGRRRDARSLLLETVASSDAEGIRPYLLRALAHVEQVLGAYRTALDRLDEAEEALTAERRHEPLRWRIAGERSEVYLELGLYDAAARHVRRERELVAHHRADGLAYRKDIISSQLHEVRLALGFDRLDEVLALVQRHLGDVALYESEPRWRAEMLAYKATALARMSRVDEGRGAAARQALHDALASDHLAKRARARCESELAVLALEDGRLDEAMGHLAAARRCLEPMREDRDRLHLPEDADLMVVEARIALAGGRSSADLQSIRDRLARSVDARLADWSAAPIRRGGIAFLHYDHRRAWFSALIQLEVALGGDGERRGLGHLLRAHAMGSLARRLGGDAVGLADVESELLSDDDHGLLAYLPGPQRSHLFVLDASGVDHELLPSDRELNDAVRRYRAELRHRLRSGSALDEERREAERLTGVLLPDATRARVGSWRSATVVGASLLGGAPFEFLVAPRPASRLGDLVAIDYLPSLTLGVQLARAARTSRFDQDLLLIAAPTVSRSVRERFPEAVDLPFGRTEARRFTACVDDDRSMVWLRDQATRARLLEHELGRTRVLHVLGHAVLDYERERPAALVLAPDDDDGLLTCDDIDRLVAAPRLVLLTSCGSGKGPARRGDEGLGHMGGAWLWAGADVVLLSDEDVDYRLAVALSERLLKRLLARGESPAEALRGARADLVKDGVVEDVVETGRLHVIGLGQRPVAPPRPPAATNVATAPTRLPWWFGLSALGLVGLLIVRRARR